MNHNVEQTSPLPLGETPPDQALIHIDRARELLAEAKTIQDAKEVADVAASAETYLRRIQASKEAIGRAQEIQVHAQRKMGGMLARAPKNPGTKGNFNGRSPSGGHLTSPPETSTVPALKEVGESSAAQRLAAIPEPAFARLVDELRPGAGLTAAKVIHRAAAQGVTKRVRKPKRVIDPKTQARLEAKARLDAQRWEGEKAKLKAERFAHPCETRFREWSARYGCRVWSDYFHPEERDAFWPLFCELWAEHFNGVGSA